MMRWLFVVRHGLQSLWRRRSFERQLDADLEFHLEEATAEYVRQGLAPADARRAALKAFGNPRAVMEDVREVAVWAWWERLIQDVRYGLRGLWRTPLVVGAAVLSIALAIGANTAIFSLFNALVLRPLPVREPATLFQVLHTGEAGPAESSTYALYEHLEAHSRTLAGLFQVDPSSSMRVVIDGKADAVSGQRVTGEYFSVLGVRPAIGNLIGPGDQRGSTSDRVVVLGHAYWTSHFGRDHGVLGRSITIDDVPHTIIGVTPPEFFGVQVGRRADLTVPIDGTDEPTYWKSRALVVRLAPGVPVDTAVADLEVAFDHYVAGDATISEHARAQGFQSLQLASASAGLPEFRDRYGAPVRAMLAIVGILLVLGCANLATLFLARAAARQRNLSMCLALGASRTRLTRQVLSETVFLVLVGGALGVVAAYRAVDLLVGYLPESGTMTRLDVLPDSHVLLFGLIATLLTGLAIGLAPLRLARRVDIRAVFASRARSVGLGGAAFHALIVVQVGLSTLLVVTATLFAVTLSNLKTQPLGFVAEAVVTLPVDADGTDIEGPRLADVHQQMLQKLQALPGVQHASFATIPPLSSNEDGKPFSILGMTFSSPEDGVLQVNTVGPNFFETFGVPLLNGRGITAADRQSAAQVAVISESMARHYFPGSQPLGRRIDVGRGRTGGQIEIVGVAADVRYSDLRTPPPRMVYVPAFQREAEEAIVFAVRTSGDAALWAQAVTREIQTVAPDMLTENARTLVAQRDERIANERLLALSSGLFGILAVLLAAIGVYGVVTYSVTQRTAELGLRIALGAQRWGVMWLVVRETFTLVVVAVLLGMAAAFLASSLLTSLLYGIQPAEPWVYSWTMALLVGVGVLSSVAPTVRAMRIDPVDTLRSE